MGACNSSVVPHVVHYAFLEIIIVHARFSIPALLMTHDMHDTVISRCDRVEQYAGWDRFRILCSFQKYQPAQNVHFSIGAVHETCMSFKNNFLKRMFFKISTCQSEVVAKWCHKKTAEHRQRPPFGWHSIRELPLPASLTRRCGRSLKQIVCSFVRFV